MIDAEMAAHPQSAPREPLRRDRERGLIAGVCAGVARHVGIDPLIVRVAFVAAATAGGAGLALYLLGWAFLSDDAAPIVAAAVLGVIFAPWVTRLVRSLAAERAERVRSQARAEMGAHLHDSVLQTLALVQKRADDPSAVAALARTQERELRAWLAGREG